MSRARPASRASARHAAPAPARTRARLRALLLLAIGALYALSIPWYRRGGDAPELWLGLPSWATVAVACYAAVAVLNCAAWLLTDLRDERPEGDPGASVGGGSGEDDPGRDPGRGGA